MPELPEVENVRLGLTALIDRRPHVTDVVVHRRDLRAPIAPGIENVLRGQKLLEVRRRAKYLLFDFSKHTVISHLGMSGSWRWISDTERKKHDHVEIEFRPGGRIVFHDPRRFGLFEVCERGTEESSRWLKHLGVEPLSEEFNSEFLRTAAAGRKVNVKAFLMDQTVVVGVGNIYASEALFLAGIRPTRAISRLKSEEFKKIVRAVKKVLLDSIRNGGTTLRDYSRVDGEAGGNQKKLFAYGRRGENCRRCDAEVRMKTLAGRSTYWCPQCQV